MTITSSSADIFTLNFTGTLTSDTVITGNAQWELTIGATKITAPLGPATLTKVVTP